MISFYAKINLIGKKHEVFLNKFYNTLIKSKKKEIEHVSLSFNKRMASSRFHQ